MTECCGARWRDEYAAMIFDCAHACIDAEHAVQPKMKLLSNHGFARFNVALTRGVAVTDQRVDHANHDDGNDWLAIAGGSAMMWTAPASGNTLDWGMLCHFGFVADAKPARGSTVALLGAATANEGALSYALVLPGPGARAF